MKVPSLSIFIMVRSAATALFIHNPNLLQMLIEDAATLCCRRFNHLEKLTDFITEAGTPDSHRANLSEMFIAWYKTGALLTDDAQQKVYGTYNAIVQMLKSMETIQEGGRI